MIAARKLAGPTPEGRSRRAVKSGASRPGGFFRILADKEATDIGSARLGNGFHVSHVFAPGSGSRFARRKTAITFEYGVVGGADFVEEAQGMPRISESSNSILAERTVVASRRCFRRLGAR